MKEGYTKRRGGKRLFKGSRKPLTIITAKDERVRVRVRE